MFETERLFVRHFEEGDLDEFAALCADPQVMRHVGDGSTLGRDQVAHWIDVCLQKYTERGYGTSAVFKKATGRFIGYCGVVRAPDKQFDELIYVYNVSAWGKGYATEAGRGMIEYVFSRSTLERIYATIHPNNVGSVKVAEKLGFVFEGTEVDEDGIPESYFVVGKEKFIA